jgi:hypothetical protein
MLKAYPEVFTKKPPEEPESILCEKTGFANTPKT